MRILVTGANGQVGWELRRTLQLDNAVLRSPQNLERLDKAQAKLDPELEAALALGRLGRERRGEGEDDGCEGEERETRRGLGSGKQRPWRGWDAGRTSGADGCCRFWLQLSLGGPR